MDEDTIFLTLEEKNQFQTITPNLSEGWGVELENESTFESDSQLQMRYQMALFKKNPAVVQIAAKIQSGEKLEDLSLETISPDLLPELYFTIGARGLSTLIATLLQNIHTNEDVQALAGLSQIRHEILQTNASVHYVP